MTASSSASLADAQARPAAPAGDPVAAKAIAPFFVVGSGRSGTTLLRMLLSNHSRLHVPPETHFIIDLVGAFPLTAALTPAQAAAAAARIVAHPHWKYMEIPAEALRAAVSALPAPRLADVIDLVYRDHLRRSGKARCGDKTPDYIAIVPQLAALYPEARFIHLIRDGHDVAMSLIELGWGQAYQGARFEWTRAVRCGLAYRRSALGERILDVRYEDLVRDPEATMRRVCAFIGETFEPAMLARKTPAEQLVAAEWQHIHRKLAEPISAEAIAVWRRKLGALECFLIEASLYRDLERLGYALRFKAALWRPLLTATGAMLRALAPLLDRALPALRRRNLLPRRIYV
jgi:hypothetical protein